MRRSDHPSRPSAINCCIVCSFKTLLTSPRVSALGSELTSWFSGLSMAGFEVTLYGRIWVTPEAPEEDWFRAEEEFRLRRQQSDQERNHG